MSLIVKRFERWRKTSMRVREKVVIKTSIEIYEVRAYRIEAVVVA